MSLNCVFDQEIKVPQGIWFNEIPGLEEIPSHTVISKTITGLGATFSEVLAQRHSIIMLPHVSIIKNKQEQYGSKYNTFAIYGDGETTKFKDIAGYLLSEVKYKKFLTTPRGLEKIKSAIAYTGKDTDKDFYKEFFLLIDECHKWVKDTGFRDDMILPMNDFFSFERKAMISATVIPFSDPRFKLQKFQNLLLKPTYSTVKTAKWFMDEPFKNPIRNVKSDDLKPVDPFKRDIKLLQVNSIANGLKEYVQSRPDDTFCIFFNSVNGIESLIADLGILAESRVFCSNESALLLTIKDAGYNVSSEFKESDSSSLAKYNFFTSSFYTGLDIKLTFKPNVVILTDCFNAPYSIVDPYTDVPQIIGRFRKGMYQEIVHINDCEKFTNPMSEENLQKTIDCSKTAYHTVEALSQSAFDEVSREHYKKLLERLYPYADFIDQNGVYSPYKEDNYRNDNRVKNYYSEPYKLSNAYRDSTHFNPVVDSVSYEKAELIKLKRTAGKYSKGNNIMTAEVLNELESIKGTFSYICYRDRLERLFPEFVNAYYRFGYSEILRLGFKISAIRKHIIKSDALEKKNSFPMIDLVYQHFHTGRAYTRTHIKKVLQELYDYMNIDSTATAVDITEYFHEKDYNMYKNNKSNRSFLLVSRKYSNFPDYKRK